MGDDRTPGPLFVPTVQPGQTPAESRTDHLRALTADREHHAALLAVMLAATPGELDRMVRPPSVHRGAFEALRDDVEWINGVVGGQYPAEYTRWHARAERSRAGARARTGGGT